MADCLNSIFQRTQLEIGKWFSTPKNILKLIPYQRIYTQVIWTLVLNNNIFFPFWSMSLFNVCGRTSSWSGLFEFLLDYPDAKKPQSILKFTPLFVTLFLNIFSCSFKLNCLVSQCVDQKISSLFTLFRNPYSNAHFLNNDWKTLSRSFIIESIWIFYIQRKLDLVTSYIATF